MMMMVRQEVVGWHQKKGKEKVIGAMKIRKISAQNLVGSRKMRCK